MRFYDRVVEVMGVEFMGFWGIGVVICWGVYMGVGIGFWGGGFVFFG